MVSADALVSSGRADTILVGGSVYTADAVGRWAEAVAIRAARIVAVGPEADLRDLAGPNTRVVDVRGGMIVPGFQDAHIHPPHAGLSMGQCDLHGVAPLDPARARDEYATIIERYATEHPDRPWILGGGWGYGRILGGQSAEVPAGCPRSRPPRVSDQP